ncbi:glycoside hydrolase family 47 protein [Schizophyllum amplum]|uniref:alpha-1,2-Mannosidase n=1 Tax=Schizophyllum amplum TaxID=97359 RepID=A0A550CTD1_9AGAR|nr:glycoside hydrolase family 47 protein [Auriculariopsis ampla]
MPWHRFWPPTLFALLCFALHIQYSVERGPAKHQWGRLDKTWTTEKKLSSRERTRELWYHGFDNYMEHAFPLDELTPITCNGQGPDWANPANIASNDVAGNFSLTLIDVLDTFVVLNDTEGFNNAVRGVIDWVSFDVNTRPQVFETTIRVMGGLLSGHIFASEQGPFHLPWYRGELLELAHDLGNRMLPAFHTPTGLPLARINLRHGLQKGETLETCTAGAGSLMLEFATLSRLTGDDRFEKAAHKAFFAIWNRKSDVGLVGNTINTFTGAWTSPLATGIGAGIDSFYEYALKWYILSGDVEFLDVWDDAYAAIMRYVRAPDGFWYRPVNMNTGDTAYATIDSLAAFWPGLQVLAGDVQSAIRLHMLYADIWKLFSGIPEVFDTSFKIATSHQYPLRPEFVESTWYLYRATHDPYYLDIADRILIDIEMRCRVECGLSGIQDLRTNKRDDRMESFALSETLKYLYLIFDEENALHSDDSHYVFTTEGHILKLGREHERPKRRKLRRVDAHQCPAYEPHIVTHDPSNTHSGLTTGIRGRPDYDYARQLVGADAYGADVKAWTPEGWCERPKVDLFAYDFILSTDGTVPPEDLSPSLLKLAPVRDGFIIHNVTGVRTHIVQRLDGRGYDVRKLGHYTIRSGQTVYINDTGLFKVSDDLGDALRIEHDVQLQLYHAHPDDMALADAQFTANDDPSDAVFVTGYTAHFGGDVTSALPFAHRGGVPVYADPTNPLGCTPFKGERFVGGVLLVDRGQCTFLEKLVRARDAGAIGVLVAGAEDAPVNPTADADELATAGDLSGQVLLTLTRKAGTTLKRMLKDAEERRLGQVMLLLDPDDLLAEVPPLDEAENEHQGEESSSQEHRILYLNGHPLMNTRIIV